MKGRWLGRSTITPHPPPAYAAAADCRLRKHRADGNLPTMTYPRAHLVDTDNGGFYHCISRCVRRGWLCGWDSLSRRSFEHRRAWLEARLLKLTTIFAVNLHAYAIMSNHYHCVVEVTPRRVDQWSDAEVAERWCRLCPGATEQETALKRRALLANQARIAELRQRLASLSWFMRSVNETIARRANREDAVTGRFWEGRFKSIALLDEAAVLACMAYVDLNPVRAKLTSRPEQAEHTSIARRVRHEGRRTTPLQPLSALGLTLEHYRALLDWTADVDRGELQQPDRETTTLLHRFDYKADSWLGAVKAHRSKYRAYGALQRLRAHAEQLGQRFLRGAKPGLAAPA